MVRHFLGKFTYPSAQKATNLMLVVCMVDGDKRS